MSGICAVWMKDNPGRLPATLAALNAGLSLAAVERGARESDEGAGVAVSARFDEQQIYRSPRVLIACDAELVNENELADSIRWKPGPAGGGRTAALLAALYERFGGGFVEKLRGGFSVVLWDRLEKRMLAAIDGFGIKRLACYQNERRLLIASRVDALAQTGEVDLDVNPAAIANLLHFSANLGPHTIFSSVSRFAPATLLIASERDTRIRKYWDMRYGVKGDTDEARLSRTLESLVERSVAIHCKNDSSAHLGAFLSGGTDSSTVVGMMERRAKGPVKAFSIGFQEQPFNELEYAELAARRFRAEHHTYLVGPRDCFDALPHIVRCFDEPFGNSSAVPTYFCARLAAQNGVKTLLTGDGGDELFGGNERYATDKVFEIYHHIPRWLRKSLIEPAVAGLPVKGGPVSRARGYIRRANMPGVERMLSYQFLSTHTLTEVFEGDFLKALGSYTVLDVPAGHYSRAAARDHLDRLLYVDVKITLADNDLPKVTCASELAGIQTRFPFLDREVAEFSGRVPARLKVKGFDKRYLFKQAFRDLLPVEIIKKKKHGFGIPVANWLKSEPYMRDFSRDVLLSARAAQRGYLRRSFVEELLHKHQSDETSYYGDTVWTLLMLELWHRQVVDEKARVAV
jgi:asparagine synthase (glutamine-hydrolysing)